MNLTNTSFIDKDICTAFPQSPRSISGTYFIATSEDKTFTICTGTITPNVRGWLSAFGNHHRKEQLLITAIGNLWKKIDYLQLSNEFDQNLISEEDYIYQLETFEEKYLIEPDENFSSYDYELAIHVASRISHRTFEEHEISEMFSIPVDALDMLVKNFDDLSNRYLIR